jgi:hypothetical protein
MEASVQLDTPASLPPFLSSKKDFRGTHFSLGSLGLRIVWTLYEKRKKFLAPAGNRTLIVQPVTIPTELSVLPNTGTKQIINRSRVNDFAIMLISVIMCIKVYH